MRFVSRYRLQVSRSRSAQNPRNPRMFSNLTFLFKYPKLFSNLTPQCSRMFSKRNVLKMPLFWPVYWHYSRKEFNKFDHPTTSGNNPNAYLTVCIPRKKKRTQIVLTVWNARQPSATCDAHFGRRSGSEAQTANGCVRHKLSFGRVRLTPRKLGSAMCIRLAFSPVLCATDLCRLLVHY